MNLLFDIGNTQIKMGVFDQKKLLSFHYIPDEKLNELYDLLNEFDIERIGISKVRSIPTVLNSLIGDYNVDVFELDDVKDLPIKLAYKTIETLGKDRLCNVIAAHDLFPKKNVLVIDLGTCNKYDFITSDGIYHGGAISPGFKMRFDAMNHFTDQLPLLKPSKTDEIIGDSTENSMRSGVFFGILGELNHFVTQYTSEFSDIELIITGGYATHFEKDLKNDIFADPYLTLRGLNIILNFQVDK